MRTPPPKHGSLTFSLLLLGAVVILALAGLAIEGNWPKVARVATAFLTYTVVLLVARGPWRGGGEDVPFRDFAAAGAGCGLVSGLVREEVHAAVVIAGTLAGSLLLGGLHYLALRGRRRFHSIATR